MKKSSFCLALAVALFVALPAQALLLKFHVDLSGANEVPPTGSPATGFADFTLDTLTNDLTGHIEFSGLVSTTTAAHIHCCLATPFGPGNVGVATLVPAFPGFPLGVTSGVNNFVLDLDLASSYNAPFIASFAGGLPAAEAAFINGLQNGMTYLNIHTAGPPAGNGFPGGEIRGFVVKVPEPMTASLLLAGLVAALASRRRSRS